MIGVMKQSYFRLQERDKMRPFSGLLQGDQTMISNKLTLEAAKVAKNY